MKELEIQIVEEAHLVSHLIEKVGDKIFSKFNLTINTFRLLNFISDNISRTSDLAEVMNLSLAGVTQKTKVLEKRKLIKRETNPKDLRSWAFKLTKQGEDILNKVNGPYQESCRELFSTMQLIEQETFLNSLKAVSLHLSEIKDDELELFILKLTK